MNENTTPPSQRGTLSNRFRKIGRWFTRSPGDVITAEIGEGSRSVIVGKNIIQIGTVVIPYWLMALGIGAISIALVVLFSAWSKIWDIGDDTAQVTQGVATIAAVANATPTPTVTPLPTPTPTPVVMPVGTYNIAVAPFQAFDSNGQQVALREAVIRPQKITNVLINEADSVALWQKFFPEGITIWGPDKHIPEVDEESVTTVAANLNANVVIYGVLEQHSEHQWKLQPFFYVAPLPERPAITLDEFVGPYSIGTPITYTLKSLSESSDLNKRLEARIRTLALVFMGLDYHERREVAGYCQAAHLFATILAEPQFHPSQFEVCQTTQFVALPALDAAGFEQASKTLAALFLGNSYLQLANELNEDEKPYQSILEQAKAAYQRGLEFDPDYPRLLNSLGNALYFEVMAKTSKSCDTLDWEQLAIAESVYRQSLTGINSTNHQQAISETFVHYIMANAYLGMGRIYHRIYYCNLNDKHFFEMAETNLTTVIELYNQQPSDLFVVHAVYAAIDLAGLLTLYINSHDDNETQFNELLMAFQSALTMSRASNLPWLVKYIEQETYTCEFVKSLNIEC